MSPRHVPRYLTTTDDTGRPVTRCTTPGEDIPCEACGESAEDDLCQHDRDLCPECLDQCRDCMTEIRDQELYDNDRDDR